MRTAVKIILAVLGLAALAVGAFLVRVAVVGIPRYTPVHVELTVRPTPERVARGRKLASLLCVNCHLDPTTRRLTGKRMTDAPPQFGVLVSPNITQDPVKGIGRWKDGELAVLLRTGLRPDGRYAPPWMVKLPHLSDEDLASILAFLRSDDPMVAPATVDPPGTMRPSFLSKLLTHTVFKPLPWPAAPIADPPPGDEIALGRYLVTGLDCFPCHSADFKTMDVGHPEKSAGYLGGGNTVLDLGGAPVRTANLTPDAETGIGRWTRADFVRALRTGVRPDGTPIRYPMVPLGELTDDEAGAIFAYLRTVPPIRNAVPRPPRVAAGSAGPATGADAGRRLYVQYTCNGCHGDDGVGIADLRQAAAHFPDRAQLVRWIRNAPDVKPGTRMPTFDGVIAEADYEPLADYVLALGRR